MTNEENFERLLTKKADLIRETEANDEQIAKALEQFEVGMTININGLPYKSTRRSGGKLFLRCQIPKSVQGEMRAIVAQAQKRPSVEWAGKGKPAAKPAPKPAKSAGKKTSKKKSS